MLTIDNIDDLLDSGRLEVKMSDGSWWALRRNGATRRWKRDPTRIRVPVKAAWLKFYDCIATYHKDLPHGGHLLNSSYIRIKE